MARNESYLDDPGVSFGKGVSKQSIYETMIRTRTEEVEKNRQVACRRMKRAGLDMEVDQKHADLQKVAYGMVGAGVSADDKALFKQNMTEFAAGDPLAQQIAARAREIVESTPGILQSGIYDHFPDYSTEQVRYALYFAHELGWIHRKKKGRSYQLFPPGRVLDSE